MHNKARRRTKLCVPSRRQRRQSEGARTIVEESPDHCADDPVDAVGGVGGGVGLCAARVEGGLVADLVRVVVQRLAALVCATALPLRAAEENTKGAAARLPWSRMVLPVAQA